MPGLSKDCQPFFQIDLCSVHAVQNSDYDAVQLELSGVQKSGCGRLIGNRSFKKLCSESLRAIA
jgi:hypothetical protein